MRLRSSHIGILLLVTCAPPATTATSAVPDDPSVQAAIATLRRDPLLGGIHTETTLHWRSKESEPPAQASQPWLRHLLEWLASGASWMARSARALAIVAITIAAAMLAVVIVRALRPTSRYRLRDDTEPPTHVSGLDIRPDELPADVARAARGLWERGEPRGAMILLYRALLSRLVHGYRVAIRDSSTEGDCLRQARAALAAAPFAYVSRFIASWQRAMYAAAWPERGDFEQLCEGFDSVLPASAVGPEPGVAGAAGT